MRAVGVDGFVSPAAGKPSVDKIPTAHFVTMPGGLFPWYDDPDQCAALVAEGLLPIPTTGSPGTNPKINRGRREQLLHRRARRVPEQHVAGSGNAAYHPDVR
jgi:hypothetical protein